MSRLIIWDNEKSVFLNDFKKNDDVVIDNKEEWEKFEYQNFSFESVIILIELEWARISVKKLYGVEIAKYLRLCKINQPIIFISYSTPQLILDKKPDAEIIATTGTSFLKIADIDTQNIESALQKTKALNDIQLADIIHNYCTLVGIAGNKFHDFKNAVRAKEKEPDKAKEEAINGLNNIKKLVSEHKKTTHDIEDLISKIKNSNISIDELLKNTEYIITAALPELYNDEETDTKEKEWAVLLVDDQISYIETLEEILKKKGITKIYSTKSKAEPIVAQAKKIIENDKKNEIAVVIADFRLIYEEDTNFNGIRHQEEQGYDFLVWLAQQDRHNRLVALSGLSRKFLYKSFRDKGIRVSVYSKNDLIGSGINIFADEMVEYGEEAHRAILHKPLSAGWLPMVPFYRYHRNNVVYEQDEVDVSNHAKSIVNTIKRILKNDEQEINTPIHELKDITANLKNKTPDKKSFIQFKNKLTARRVALWLLYCENFKREQVASLLLEQTIICNDMENTRVSQLFSQMGLDLNDFPYNILVEEKRWLKECMGIDIYTLEDVLTQIGVHFEEALEKFFKIYKKIPDDIIKEGCIINENNKIEVAIFSYNHGKSLLEKIFEIIDESAKAEFLNIVDELIQKIETDEHCKNYLTAITEVIYNLRRKIRYFYK